MFKLIEKPQKISVNSIRKHIYETTVNDIDYGAFFEYIYRLMDEKKVRDEKLMVKPGKLILPKFKIK